MRRPPRYADDTVEDYARRAIRWGYTTADIVEATDLDEATVRRLTKDEREGKVKHRIGRAFWRGTWPHRSEKFERMAQLSRLWQREHP